MAAITTAAIGVATAGASLYMSARQAKKGSDQAKEAKEALDNYKRQKLENPYEGMKVSAMGSDLAREESARNYASSINAMQSAGISGLSLLPQVTATNNALNRQIGADLDRQFIDIENTKARGRAQVQQMEEQREIQDIAGLGMQQYVGEQNYYTGLQNAIKSVPMVAQSAGNVIGTLQSNRGGVDNSWKDNSNYGTGAIVTRKMGSVGDGFASPPTVSNASQNNGWAGVPYSNSNLSFFPTDQWGRPIFPIYK